MEKKKKRSSFKRIISFSTALCLGLGFVPQVSLPARAANVGDKIKGNTDYYEVINETDAKVYRTRFPEELFIDAFAIDNDGKKYNVTTIDAYTFSGGNNVPYVLTFGIPNTNGVPPMKYIGDWAFRYDRNMTVYNWRPGAQSTYPAPNLIEIGEHAFDGCNSLNTPIFGNALEIIGDYAFNNCYSIESLTFPDTFTTMGSAAFINCTGLKKINNTGSIKEIPLEAFRNCTSLKTANLSSGLEVIDNHSFNGCASLTTVTLPDTLEKIGSSAFLSSGLTELDLPSSLKEVGAYAFCKCEKLNSVFIPSSVTKIGDKAFGFVSDGSGNLVPKDGFTIECVAGSVAEQYADKNGITKKIDYFDGDFQYQPLDDDTIEIVKYLGNDENVTVPDTIDDKSVSCIGGGAFFENNDLKYVYLPNSIKSIGKSAFSQAKNLEYVEWPEHLVSIGEMAFANTKIDDITLYGDDLRAIGNYAFYACRNLTYVYIPDGVEEVGRRAFMLCTSLSEISFPTTVQTINEGIDENTAMSWFYIPSGVKKISANAFTRCKDIYVPESVTEIEEGAFNVNVEDCTIYGFSGSAAETYANEHDGISFVDIEALYRTHKLNHTANGGTVAKTVDPKTRKNSYKYSFDAEKDGMPFACTRMTTDITLNFKDGTKSSIYHKISSTFRPGQNTSTFPSEVSKKKLTSAFFWMFYHLTKGKKIDDIVLSFTADPVYSTTKHVEAKEPTCGEDGNIEYWYNSADHKFYSDEAMTAEITDTETIVIPATGKHTWVDGDTTLEPTCHTPGKKAHSCSVCGLTEEIGIPATGNHTYGEWSVTKAATCTEDGEQTRSCTTEGCDAIETEVITAPGHTWGEWTITDATCEGAGSITRKCTICDATETKDIEPVGHTWGEPIYKWAEDLSEVAATAVCTADSTHTVSETVKATKEEIPATFEAVGKIIYTATFENKELFKSQIKEVEIPQLTTSAAVTQPVTTVSEAVTTTAPETTTAPLNVSTTAPVSTTTTVPVSTTTASTTSAPISTTTASTTSATVVTTTENTTSVHVSTTTSATTSSVPVTNTNSTTSTSATSVIVTDTSSTTSTSATTSSVPVTDIGSTTSTTSTTSVPVSDTSSTTSATSTTSTPVSNTGSTTSATSTTSTPVTDTGSTTSSTSIISVIVTDTSLTTSTSVTTSTPVTDTGSTTSTTSTTSTPVTDTCSTTSSTQTTSAPVTDTGSTTSSTQTTSAPVTNTGSTTSSTQTTSTPVTDTGSTTSSTQTTSSPVTNTGSTTSSTQATSTPVTNTGSTTSTTSTTSIPVTNTGSTTSTTSTTSVPVSDTSSTTSTTSTISVPVSDTGSTTSTTSTTSVPVSNTGSTTSTTSTTSVPVSDAGSTTSTTSTTSVPVSDTGSTTSTTQTTALVSTTTTTTTTPPVIPDSAKIVTATVNNETKKIEATLASEDVAHEDGVKVKADNGMTVALDKDAAGKLGATMKEKGIDHIVMNISLEPDLSTLTPEAAAAVEEAKKNGAVVFDFSFINTDKNEKVEFDTASAGAIVVELPLTAEQKEAFSKYDKAVVVSVGSDGSIEYMPTWYNAETGVLTFTAKRPASYMAMKDDRKSGPELKPEMIGDLDGDGKAIATDAAMLLKLYAELSSGGRDATATELYLCDVNRNGKIEAGDAAFVLKYYAEASGGYDKTIDVYLKEVLNIAI